MEAPFTSTGAVAISSTSSMRAGLRKSICMERTTKAKPGASFADLLEQRALVGAEQPQIVGPAALHEAQIARVIDDAGKVGVLVIDPDRLMMPSVADFAVERVCLHRHGTSCCIAASQLRPSNRFGVIGERIEHRRGSGH